MHRSAMVANRLLALARVAGRELTPMQLLKLVFLCHAWMLGLYNQPLIRDKIQAWKYGPVIPDLYRAVCAYKDQPITRLIPCGEGTFTAIEEDLIRQVFDAYGFYSGPQLSDITHEPGSPWDHVWTRGGRNQQIPDNIIENYYEKLARRQPVTATR